MSGQARGGDQDGWGWKCQGQNRGPSASDELDCGHLGRVASSQRRQRRDASVPALAVLVPQGRLLENGLDELRIVHIGQSLGGKCFIKDDIMGPGCGQSHYYRDNASACAITTKHRNCPPGAGRGGSRSWQG